MCTEEQVKRVSEEHRCRIKCQAPLQHLKFYFKIHMHHSYVEFNLEEGHSRVFMSFKPQFVVAFRDCFDNLDYIGAPKLLDVTSESLHSSILNPTGTPHGPKRKIVNS